MLDGLIIIQPYSDEPLSGHWSAVRFCCPTVVLKILFTLAHESSQRHCRQNHRWFIRKKFRRKFRKLIYVMRTTTDVRCVGIKFLEEAIDHLVSIIFLLEKSKYREQKTNKHQVNSSILWEEIKRERYTTFKDCLLLCNSRSPRRISRTPKDFLKLNVHREIFSSSNQEHHHLFFFLFFFG